MRTMFYRSNANTFRFAKKLRGRMTGAEQFLWCFLSTKQMNGYRFKRQHPIRNYVADFYCHKAKLIIEVDGKIHEQEEQANHDKERTDVIQELGCHVLRFTNDQVMNHIEDVLDAIRKELPQTPPTSPKGEAPSGVDTPSGGDTPSEEGTPL